MATALTVENLGACSARPLHRIDGLGLLLALEAWLDHRASRRAIYAFDETALADLGLSRADAERIARPSGP